METAPPATYQFCDVGEALPTVGGPSQTWENAGLGLKANTTSDCVEAAECIMLQSKTKRGVGLADMHPSTCFLTC